jgi:hypothetical protein
MQSRIGLRLAVSGIEVCVTGIRESAESGNPESDGIADWPLLDAMAMCASQADLVAIHRSS